MLLPSSLRIRCLLREAARTDSKSCISTPMKTPVMLIEGVRLERRRTTLMQRLIATLKQQPLLRVVQAASRVEHRKQIVIESLYARAQAAVAHASRCIALTAKVSFDTSWFTWKRDPNQRKRRDERSFMSSSASSSSQRYDRIRRGVSCGAVSRLLRRRLTAEGR